MESNHLQGGKPPVEKALNCPRCNSTKTKFCYYNNYSLLQPRYFCKTCRRYWTEGGSLRNVPVGGGSRKNKRSSSSSASASSASVTTSSSMASAAGAASQLNSEDDIFPEEQWNLLLERSRRLRELEGDPSALRDEATAILAEARGLYQTSPAFDAYRRFIEIRRAVLDFLQGHLAHGIEYSIINYGAYGAEAGANRMTFGDHTIDGNGYNVPTDFSVQNDPGQRNLFPSSSRAGAGSAATWYSPFVSSSGGGSSYGTALHSPTRSNEDIPEDIEVGRTGYGGRATGKEKHPGGGGHMQEGTGDWDKPWVLGMMGVFAGAGVGCLEGYSVIKEVFGPKWAPYAFAPLLLSVGMLGAGIVAALWFDKSPRPKTFTKYASLLLIVIVVALLGFMLGFMIFG